MFTCQTVNCTVEIPGASSTRTNINAPLTVNLKNSGLFHTVKQKAQR